MKKNFLTLTIFLFLKCYVYCSWQEHYHQACESYYKSQHQEASLKFDLAISMMSDIDLQNHPYVLLSRAENDYFLGNFLKALEDTEKALMSTNLTDFERFNCASKRISLLMKVGKENQAVEEYKKYIIGCPLLPKYEFFEDKIIIRNILDNESYKAHTKKLLLDEFCNREEDIYNYGNTWIINITKKNCNCFSSSNLETSKDNSIINPSTEINSNNEQAQACCNTCNKLAACAFVICGCIDLTGLPITSIACKLACSAFVEEIRQLCEKCCHNGGITGKCWKKFETWKDDYHKENPDCPHPPAQCS